MMAILLALAASLAAPFPAPQRAVADVVSAGWDDPARRDQSHEVQQIAARLHIGAGTTVADIGAGEGYDSLRLARLVGPRGEILAEDITPDYLARLAATARAQGLANVRTVQGTPDDPRLPPHAIDAAIMVHMYHEIAQPYALLWRLADAFRPGGQLGIEELDRPTARHGTPPALLSCELAAVGYRRVSLSPLEGGLGYFAVFAPPAPGARPAPDAIRPCRG